MPRISKTQYSLKESEKIGGYIHGEYGDPRGFEETLYQSKNGEYFIVGKGGMESRYKGENIISISNEDANQWINQYC